MHPPTIPQTNLRATGPRTPYKKYTKYVQITRSEMEMPTGAQNILSYVFRPAHFARQKKKKQDSLKQDNKCSNFFPFLTLFLCLVYRRVPIFFIHLCVALQPTYLLFAMYSCLLGTPLPFPPRRHIVLKGTRKKNTHSHT